ncbi:MAG TPA: response regulator transcription factor [Thermotoga sp.]|nr:response regulator transcription factor [Thermotoga sp.]
MRVLVVEDDEKIARLLRIVLEENDYEVKVAHDGEEALYLYETYNPHLIVLDLMLPKIDGFTVLEKIRENDEEIGIIVLTARGEIENRVKGLKKGADDYIPKPFHLEELLARIERVAKRIRKVDRIEVNGIVLDIENWKLVVDGKEIDLSEKEFALLKILFENRGRVLSRKEILESIWGDSENISKNIVDVYIKHLRDKLGNKGEVIKTVRGKGYGVQG